jgi:precorrin-6B methylase 2
MLSARSFFVGAILALTFCFNASAQEAAKKQPATIKILIPETPTKTTLKVENKELDANEKAAKEGQRVLTTPDLEITFKAGEEVTLDLRKKDDKIKDDVQIRWVPTPKIVVKDMCELAKVTKDDVVMDPGCGDCIMVITAVQDFKAKKGIGTDFDPKKVQESIEAVEKAGLKDKISVREANALKLEKKDLEEVTVVMLYMGDELNIRLRPALFEHLKPGSRVVSHRFMMGDWAPDKSITVTREGDYGIEDFELHVWTITGKEKMGMYNKKKD